MNNEINLMSQKAEHKASNFKKRFTVHYIAIGFMFFVSFCSIAVFILIALSPLPSLNQREKDETKRLSLFSDTIVKLQKTDDRINNISNILKSRAVYSESIKRVQAHLSDNAVIEEIHLNEKVLSVTIASSSLSVLEKFIASMTEDNAKSKFYKKVTLVSLYKDFIKGKFVMTLELISL